LATIGFRKGNEKTNVRLTLQQFLADKRSRLIDQWRNLIIGSYPPDAQRFLKREKNRFANPVGQTIAEDVEIIFDAIIQGDEMNKIRSNLDNIIRIRAVQDFTPSQAVGFVLSLKKVIRDELKKGGEHTAEASDELEKLDERIDNMALAAFDIYSQCRHKLFELRINETRNQVSRLLKLANLTIEIPENPPDLKE
jgi:hypothetical protein